jgi:23S rRNA (adenine2030-N6)-methyltransferase
MRPQDRLTLVELHPEDAAELAIRFSGDYQVRTIQLDGWLALGSFVPPKERRGLILVDPPYEERGEFDRLFDGFRKAHARWPTGIYALWYPIKDTSAARTFVARLRDSGIPKVLQTELWVRSPSNGRFTGSGLILVNPPWRFDHEIREVLEGLAPVLAEGPGAGATVEWLTSEDGRPSRA